MIDTRITIGEAARRTGVKTATIRYYEQVGLMPYLSRTSGNRRLYSDTDVQRLNFIRHARDLGFGLPAIASFLKLKKSPQEPCSEVDTLAESHLQEVEERIRALEELREELVRMIAGCKRGRVEQCRVLEVIGDHNLCLREHAPTLTFEVLR